jgi:hypothetical protein
MGTEMNTISDIANKSNRKLYMNHLSSLAKLREARLHIEKLEAALRAIDNAIPKNDPTLPAICLIAGDIAEGALNGTWPAFGVMPRAALEKKDGN